MSKNPVKQEIEVNKLPEVEVVSEEHKPEEVEVNLDKQETPAPDPGEKLRNQMFYELRQQEKRLLDRQRQMQEEILARISGTQQAQPQKVERETNSDWDEQIDAVAQKDYQKAVRMLSAKEAEKIVEERLEAKLKAREEELKTEQTRQHALRVEAKGREKVLAEYPNIMDESSKEFQEYIAIYNREVAEDPSFMYNPRKHEIILPELRERIKGSAHVEVNPEIERLRRVAAGSATPSRASSSPNKVMLTQDEIEMCKRSGIPVETYARTKKLGAAGLKEGVVIDE